MLRRKILGLGISTASLSLFGENKVLAMSRPHYGGTLRLTLPLDLSRLDPHDPENLAAALFGPSLFETLYALSPSGQAYPTLASSLPELRSGRLQVHLRKGMHFASGRPLMAKDAVASLRRSQRRSKSLHALGTPSYRSASPRLITFPKGDPHKLALLLSSPRASLLPKNFSPSRPDSCGALRVERTGAELRLVRNALCPRGASFFDEVIVRSDSLTGCLRAFESTRSDLGFLGEGLHQARKNTQTFRLAGLAQVFVLPGEGLRHFARPGVLHSALSHLPSQAFSALGLRRGHSQLHRWSGPPFTLLVPSESPWLLAIAEEISLNWTRPGAEIHVEPASRSLLLSKRMSKSYDAILGAVSTAGLPPSTTSLDLFELSEQKAPRSGRSFSPTETARQLPLGLVGELRPHGALIREVDGLITKSHLDFSNGRFRNNPNP